MDDITKAQAMALAESVADQLFEVGHSGEQADKLRLVDASGRDMGGGWSRDAVVRILATALST